MLINITDRLIRSAAPDLNVGNLYQARLLINSSFLSALLLAPFLLTWLYLSQGFTGQGVFLSITLLALIATPLVLKLSRSANLAGIFLNFISTLTLIGFAFVDGGLNSTAMPWFPVLPLFSAFFSGKKYGLFISCVLSIALLSFLYLHGLDLVPNSTLDQNTFGIMYTASSLSAVFIIIFVAFSYLNWQQAVREQLIKANNTKNDFLSGVSHELRTPLNSIIGFSDVLTKGYEGELNEKQTKFVENINSSGEHLLQLVNTLLDISKIDAGESAINKNKTHIYKLCNDAISMVQNAASTKDVSIVTNISETKNLWLYVDGTKIKQILLNLLSNAIKFSPTSGTVFLSSSADKDYLLFTLEDEGPGVPKPFSEKIFERFFQLHAHESGKTSGTGLGLSISKHFVELHGGKIHLKDSDKGAKFSFSIPLKKEYTTSKKLEQTETA